MQHTRAAHTHTQQQQEEEEGRKRRRKRRRRTSTTRSNICQVRGAPRRRAGTFTSTCPRCLDGVVVTASAQARRPRKASVCSSGRPGKRAVSPSLDAHEDAADKRQRQHHSCSPPLLKSARGYRRCSLPRTRTHRTRTRQTPPAALASRACALFAAYPSPLCAAATPPRPHLARGMTLLLREMEGEPLTDGLAHRRCRIWPHRPACAARSSRQPATHCHLPRSLGADPASQQKRQRRRDPPGS